MPNVSSAANAFTLGAAGSASGTPGAQGAPAANDPSGSFMRLVSGMIQGNTTGDQLPANLVDFLLTGDSSALEGLELETDEKSDTDTEDEDGDGAGELALAAILAGVQAMKPVPTSHSAQSDRVAGIDVSSGQAAMQALANTAQEALTSAMDDAGSDASSQDAAADLSAQAQPANANSAAPLHHLLTAHKAAEAAPQAASAEVRTPVGAPGWADEIGTHLTLMAANGREAASLRLSPEHLGPVEVRISMKDGDASVVFTAANADTRSALEQSLPRLREMFASQGLVLGDANVSREGPRDTFRPATFANASRGSSDAGSNDDVNRVTLSRVGLVDTYA